MLGIECFRSLGYQRSKLHAIRSASASGSVMLWRRTARAIGQTSGLGRKVRYQHKDNLTFQPLPSKASNGEAVQPRSIGEGKCHGSGIWRKYFFSRLKHKVSNAGRKVFKGGAGDFAASGRRLDVLHPPPPFCKVGSGGARGAVRLTVVHPGPRSGLL